MKQVTTREFQLHQSTYLKALPVELTQYGKVVAIVNQPEPARTGYVVSADIDTTADPPKTYFNPMSKWQQSHPESKFKRQK